MKILDNYLPLRTFKKTKIQNSCNLRKYVYNTILPGLNNVMNTGEVNIVNSYIYFHLIFNFS